MSRTAFSQEHDELLFHMEKMIDMRPPNLYAVMLRMKPPKYKVIGVAGSDEFVPRSEIVCVIHDRG